ALATATKHARATAITICAQRLDGALLVEVGDDGVGGADPDGSGLRGLADRVAALDGDLRVHSPTGAGTHVTAELPCGSRSPTTRCCSARAWRGCSKPPASRSARRPTRR